MSSAEPAAHGFVVAIDGPAASGKSSTAKLVAGALGFRHVDSGALYRALAYVRLRQGGAPEDWSEASVLAGGPSIGLHPGEGSFLPTLEGRVLDQEIRRPDVNRVVSRVAAMAGVRGWVNSRVRQAAVLSNIVVDGRDIGTVVFPDALLKVFLVADPWERARRRLLERLRRQPTEDEIALETEELVSRDARDATQTVQAADAILIDTTYITQPQQVERIVALTRAALATVATAR